MGSFDIRSAVAGRNYVTAQVKFWLEDKVFYDLESAWAEHAKITKGDDPRLAEIEAEISRLEKVRDDSAYVLHLRAISNRSNEDIISKALSEWPVKRDMYGREEEAQQIGRGKLIREMQMAAHMVKVVTPEGEGQVIDDENRRDVARVIIDNAPPITLKIIDEAIKQLNKEFNTQLTKEQDTDFLSKH